MAKGRRISELKQTLPLFTNIVSIYGDLVSKVHETVSHLKDSMESEK
jgi:hypothetical protein